MLTGESKYIFIANLPNVLFEIFRFGYNQFNNTQAIPFVNLKTNIFYSNTDDFSILLEKCI